MRAGKCGKMGERSRYIILLHVTVSIMILRVIQATRGGPNG